MEHIPSLTGKGLDVVKMINKLPFQLHLPGHNFTGPGTHLYRNLVLGLKSVNKVDEAALEHDLAYANNGDKKLADKILIDKTHEIYKNPDNSLREKGEAFLVNKIIKVKNLIGFGINDDLLSMKTKFIKFLEESNNIVEEACINNNDINSENLEFLQQIANEYNFIVNK